MFHVSSRSQNDRQINGHGRSIIQKQNPIKRINVPTKRVTWSSFFTSNTCFRDGLRMSDQTYAGPA